jgi:hypothetical protein
MPRPGRGGRQVSLGTAILAVLIAGALGSAVSIASTWEPAPDSLERPSRSGGSIRVDRQAFDDPQPVELAAELSTPAEVLSTGDGIVTAYECRAGRTVTAGRVLARVGEAPVVALATSIPLYRDITADSRGRDVDALHDELQRLRLIDVGSLAAGSVAGPDTIRALVDLANLPRTTRRIPAAAFAWLPGPAVKAAQCATAIGARVSTGTPLIELAPDVSEVSLKSRPSGVVPGRRLLTMDGTSVQMGPRGTIDSSDAIRRLLTTPTFQAFLSSDGTVPLQATWVLAQALDVAALPASSVVVTAGSACVSRSGVGYPVQIVTSELGNTLVEMDRTIATVDAAPPDDLTCA